MLNNMEIKEFLIKDLKPATYNPRSITEEEFNGLKASLDEFGLVDPIIINKDLTIIGGHMRTRAWEALGHTHIHCYQLDLDKHEEKKLNIILNSQKISGSYNQELLDEVLEELKLDDNYLELRLDKLEQLDLSEDVQEPGDTMNESQELCPHCGMPIKIV